MSVKIMGMVWDLDIDRDMKFVLLAYADHASHDGENVFPSVKTIASKTGYSERSVQRITRQLEDDGYLVPMGGQKGGQGITPHWRIPVKGDKIAPFPKGDKSSRKRVTKTASKGDIAVSPESSLTVNINRNDDEEERPNLFRIYEQEIGVLTPSIAENLKLAEGEHSEEWVTSAIRQASANNARSWSYVNAILRRWAREGYGTDSRKNGKKNGKSNDKDRYANWEE